jgi:hypothetical protein
VKLGDAKKNHKNTTTTATTTAAAVKLLNGKTLYMAM